MTKLLESLHARHADNSVDVAQINGTIYHVRTPATAPTAPGHGQNRVRYLTMDHVIERWLPVVGFEGYYEVSSLGRVRSVDRIITARNGRKSHLRGRLKKTNIHKSGGYPLLGLNRPGAQKTFCMHRLVAMAFHGPPPEGKPVIRHLNGNPLDNRPENLTWGTMAENSADMVRHGRAYWRKQTHCVRDHEFTPENTRVTFKPNGAQIRNCRKCEAIRSRAGKLQRRQQRQSELPTLTCQVCGAKFVNNIPWTRNCSEECRRINRRKEFGWDPTLRRRSA